MIRVKHKGDFSKTITFLKKSETLFQNYNFSRFGEEAINALADATPKDTGLTSQSWVYKIEKTKTKVKISFYNTNIQNGVIIALLLQYGHATTSGTWIEGRDYINPAILPVFEKLKNDMWKEVTNL